MRHSFDNQSFQAVPPAPSSAKLKADPFEPTCPVEAVASVCPEVLSRLGYVRKRCACFILPKLSRYSAIRIERRNVLNTLELSPSLLVAGFRVCASCCWHSSFHVTNRRGESREFRDGDKSAKNEGCKFCGHSKHYPASVWRALQHFRMMNINFAQAGD